MPPAQFIQWSATRAGGLVALAVALLLGACAWGVAHDTAGDEVASRLAFRAEQVEVYDHHCVWSGIAMRNISDVPVTIDGWAMGSYPIPRMTIQPGETITFWAGTGTDDAANRYTNQPRGVWGWTNITSPPRTPLLERTPVGMVGVSCDYIMPPRS